MGLSWDGQAQYAAEIYGMIVDHPLTNPHLREEFLMPLLADLEVALDTETLAAAIQRGQSLVLETVVQEIAVELEEYAEM